ncbi:hypothetical protein WICMUC_002905 [Wickerhamomyces mucosus]|uniref:DNA helicase n=1 Tax=Wickerhamomyces mucosus TaxID=1378264 RepID=A0A9P8PML0_9ASCO|nr:hypothetical protein WICMUC_002905 [Wickerhamomyces mucosus]
MSIPIINSNKTLVPQILSSSSNTSKPDVTENQVLHSITQQDPLELTSTSITETETTTITTASPLQNNTKPPLQRKSLVLKQKSSPKEPELKKPKTDNENSSDITNKRFFEVVWRKRTTKKNKTWDGDGFIILSSTNISLRKDCSESYKEISRSGKVSAFTTDGVTSLGMYEVEVMGEIIDKEEIEKLGFNFKPSREDSPIVISPNITRESTPSLVNSKGPTRNINKQFKQVIPRSESSIEKPTLGEPLYDSTLPDSIVMKKKNDYDIDVVIDPFIAKKLRPHQIKGVKFLYECLMGLKEFDGNGALLADDMGLGKTLQTITLLWTLVRQSPKGFQTPVVNKVLIACPVTLITNWKKELKKWLPMNRLNVLTLNSKNTIAKDKQDLQNFSRTKVYQVLIMGYEKILNMKEELKKTNFDLLVCDEGHRLKNNSNKTLQALNSLEIEKRILLSGTPIQNDLSEFFNIIDFINPSVLGTFNHFKKRYMNPILRSREIGGISAEVLELGEDRSKELIDLTKPFILRRTSAILSKHLPPRTDVVLFCTPTKTQISLFNQVLISHRFNSMIQINSSATTLGLITMFKKICNSPSLISSDKIFKELDDVKDNTQVGSGKINVLIELLKELSLTEEKVVIVSNYTQTLDIIQAILETLEFTYTRLDGSTPGKDRDSIVTKFNTTHSKAIFAFLLSSKSGGVGLNLIGASRLILFDNDWNPAVDLQAMARIHRDGQNRPVFIYRLITTGSIDEKIFQRQLMKNNLSDKFLDNKNESKDDLFEQQDLKDLFTLRTDTVSNTHDLMECNCSGIGEDIEIDEEAEQLNDRNGSTGQKIKIEDEPSSKGWKSALLLRNDSILNENEEKKSVIIQCLKGYRHINPVNFSNSSEIDVEVGDDITENIIKNRKKLISFVMTKINKTSL